MDLSVRLKSISNLVDKCNTIVDVGTDHGYVPIYLIENNICDNAIASDINKGPIERAQNNIDGYGLCGKIQCRLGSGLTTIKPKEAQGAVIAGMGGNLIRDIIMESYETFKVLDFAILQPSQNPEVLRKFLCNEGITILEEDICFDEGIYYEIIKVKFEKANKVELPYIYYEISPYLMKTKNPLMNEYIDKKIEENEKVLNKIKDTTDNAVERKKTVENKIKELKELKTWL